MNEFVDLVLSSRDPLFITGIGKSSIVGRRLAASLSSTGTPAVFVHASEWAHGDLGLITGGGDDNRVLPPLVIALSHSGRTQELLHACMLLRERGGVIGCICSESPERDGPSSLAEMSQACLTYELPGDVAEPLGGAPTCSIVAQEALANALISELIHRRAMTQPEFKLNHPGGALGAAL